MTTSFQTIAFSIFALLMSVSTAGAERVDLWEFSKFKDGAFATDCRDCEEDRGIDLQCGKGFGRGKVRIAIPGVAAERGKAGQRVAVILRVGGWKRLYRARLETQELIGHLPFFTVPLSSPLLRQLEIGDSVVVRVHGVETRFGLRGSGVALRNFRSACR